MHSFRLRSAFTLIELLVVVAIIAVLAVVVILTLNPAALLQQSRDTNRLSDMNTINSSLSFYGTDQAGSAGFTMGSSNVIYVSLPDPAATSTAGTNCASLNLPTLPSPYTYHCAASSTFQDVNGTGWIPVNLSSVSGGVSPISILPVDPTNTSSSHLYYTYTTNGTQYEVTAAMESQKYQPGGSNDAISTDGGPLATVYEKGTQLGLEPLDYGPASLIAYWPLSEGTGTVAYDWSGAGNNGSWAGIPGGTAGYYSPGNVGSWAGYLNGTSDYINLGSYPSIQTTYTVSLWLNISSSTGTIFNRGSSAACFYNPRLTLTGSVLSATESGCGGTGLIGTLSLTPGQWYYITIVRSGSSVSFYANGALVASLSSIPVVTPSGGQVSVGQVYTGSGFGSPYQGLVGDIRMYNKALSQAQIQAMYNGRK